MAPLEGHTLGQRQKYYNQLVKQAIANKTGDLPKINFEEDDVDNMMKIDIACKERNVDYILDVFKSEDMLYVSRAINKSTWLITEAQYAHVINPKFLHKKLFPQMNAKAVTKLMLHIRRYIKDEVRAKAFYKYVCETNPKAALHWLGNCSIEFIETIVAARAKEIPVKLLKRLCQKSINILRIFATAHTNRSCESLYEVFSQIKHFLKSNKTAEEFIDIMDPFWELRHMHFNGKCTNMLLKNCPTRILDNFNTFHELIDLNTFVKFIKTDNIRSFLMKNLASGTSMSFATLKPFLSKLPREDNLDLLSILYGVDISNADSEEKSVAESLFYAIEGGDYNSFSDIYRWYQFAPFDIAFRDIKKFIFAESSPEERHAMLIILLTCANYDFEHVKTVLQYYHDKHINEPYLHKITFVNNFLTQHDTFRFDDSTWSTLNAIFHSLEVYIESGNAVQACLSSVIVHNVLRDMPVSTVVEEKFEIKPLKDVKKKLNSLEQDKLFNYLYNLSVTKLRNQSTNSETGMHEAIKLLKSIWNLLKDWNKVETHNRFVIDKIAEFGNINKASAWIKETKKNRRKRRKKRPNQDWKLTWEHFKSKPEPYINIPSIYNMVKSYRKELFENSLVLHASEEVFLNALKHDPNLFTHHKSEVDDLRCDDETSLKRFFSKLRVYWADSLATEWTEANIKNLQCCTGHRALVRGVLILLPRKKLLDFIKMYTPNENKIHWSDANEIELSLQKHIAKNMHIARPQLPAETVLWYAKGDYLQYAHLSLNTMYHNLKSSEIRKHINILLNAPVSLQKHGIRLAFTKLKTTELINISPRIWKNRKNSTIRAVLFTSMFGLLCKEKKQQKIKAIWAVVSSFIDDLNHQENKIIYQTLGRVSDVPLSVIGACYQKAYLFLKSLPPKADLDQILKRVFQYARKCIVHLDRDFVEKSLLVSIYNAISCRDRTYMRTLSAYLLCSEDVEIQMQKYNNVLHPAIEQCVQEWPDATNGLEDFLEYICADIPRYVFEMKMKMPVEILGKTQKAFDTSLDIKKQYIFIRRWQLSVAYLEMLDEIMKKSDEPYTWDQIRCKSTRNLAGMCVNFLAADETQFFMSIYILFKQALQSVFQNFNIGHVYLLNVLYIMLDYKDIPLVYLLVLKMIPGYGCDDEFKEKKDYIKRKIYLYPSEEVKMHYFRKFRDTYTNSDDEVGDSDEDSHTEDSQETADSEEESQDEQNAAHDRLKQDPVLLGSLCNLL